MKRSLVAIIIIILISSILYSQLLFSQNKSHFAGIRMGYALPMGEMASHEYGYGGYALLGKTYGAEAAWFITPKFGVGIDISSSSFGFASGFYAEDYLENSPEFSSVDLLAGPYDLKTYMGGIYYKITLLPKFYSTFKLMGGVFKARTPDQFYGVNTFMIGKLYFWKTGSTDIKFTFLSGASFEYQIYEHVSVLLQADFTYTQAGFKYDKGKTSFTDHLHMPVFKLQPGININF